MSPAKTSAALAATSNGPVRKITPCFLRNSKPGPDAGHLKRLADFDRKLLDDIPAVIGVDEAGRGPLAGPVCAAAVYLDRAFFASKWFFEYAPEVNDSKQLKESTRERLFDAIREEGAGMIHFSCHMAPVGEIETVNILGATRRAMARCIDELQSNTACPFHRVFEGDNSLSPAAARQTWLFQSEKDDSVARLLVDGLPLKPFPHAHTAIVKGDATSLSIALASIVAKVSRDRFMREQAKRYPDYGFCSNKGYGTPGHLTALRALGPSELHRMSFLRRILVG